MYVEGTCGSCQTAMLGRSCRASGLHSCFCMCSSSMDSRNGGPPPTPTKHACMLVVLVRPSLFPDVRIARPILTVSVPHTEAKAPAMPHFPCPVPPCCLCAPFRILRCPTPALVPPSLFSFLVSATQRHSRTSLLAGFSTLKSQWRQLSCFTRLPQSVASQPATQSVPSP